jgi:hypothetical protein
MHTQVGLQALRVSLRDDTTMFCFTFRHDGDVPLDDVWHSKSCCGDAFATSAGRSGRS